MSTITREVAKLASPARTEWYPEASGQSFKKGEFVYLVSGKVTVLPSTAQSQVKILGLAMQDASGTVDTAIAVAIAEEGVLFEMNITSTTAITQVGASYGITITSNKHYVNVSDTTERRFKVKALSPKDAVGDTYGRVLVEVIGQLCQVSGQTS
jgi:hypothetical protein